ncbi:hypothetical protein [Parasediminibacterium sp. JCM 36343]|uniref:hypothetical protein n=1 Tax=Parasediminibacterium sp. JCM 36343 TaxID=3374279 RepID=UPI003979876F
MVNIIFRTCDVVLSVHQVPRPFGLDKKQTIEVSFKSLVAALIGIPHTITVLGDKLSEDMRAFFSKYPVLMVEGDFGNDASIRKSIELACAFPPDEWVYFCEDDYLHRKETFRYIFNFTDNLSTIIAPPTRKKLFRKGNEEIANADIVVFPPDYPDRYSPDRRKQSYIFVSKDCHWRQVNSTTFTFLAKSGFINKNKSVFLTASKNADDGYMSRKLFGKKRFGSKSLCVSPIPSLACHLHTTSMSALIDWEQIALDCLK